MKKLYRSQNDRLLSGVCGGLAAYLNFSCTLIRLLAVVISLCTAVLGGILIYIIATVIIPTEPNYYDI